MNLLNSMALVPTRAWEAEPQDVGTLDLMSLLTALQPPAPPRTIEEATARRQEFREYEKRKKESKPFVQAIIDAMGKQAKRNKEKEEEDEGGGFQGLLIGRAIRTAITEALSVAWKVGAFLLRATVKIMAWIATTIFNIIGRVIMLLVANPWVALALGVVALGVGGYYYFKAKVKPGGDPKKREDIVVDTAVTPIETTKNITPPPVAPVTAAEPQAKAMPEQARHIPQPAPVAPASQEQTKPSASASAGKASAAKVKNSKAKPAVISQSVTDAILNASQVVGVPVNLLTALAGVESSFGQNVKASTSSASGLFQFIKSTWAEQLSKYGDRYGVPAKADPFDEKWSAIMAAAMIKHEGYPAVAKITPSPSITDIYLTHFMGAAGGSAFLRGYLANPDQAATNLANAKQVRANDSIFYDKARNVRTAKQVYELFMGRLQQQLDKGSAILAAANPKEVVASAPPKQEALTVASTGESIPAIGTPDYPPQEEIVRKGRNLVRVNV